MQSHEKNRENTPTSEVGTTDELLVHVPARWGDMDAYGHVNNVAILSVMEEARVALFGPPPSSPTSPSPPPAPPTPPHRHPLPGLMPPPGTLLPPLTPAHPT